MCGGTPRPQLLRRRRRGLSPRVRGNLVLVHAHHAVAGSIPACAGEPRHTGYARHDRRVYPRVCGGTHCLGFPGFPELGLSPRVRGNPPGGGAAECRQQSIPACAGEPPYRHPPQHPGRVYPRVCGGTLGMIGYYILNKGLSPRVRGNLTPSDNTKLTGRSIPACAGEPPFHCLSCKERTVYPRVCGGTQSRPALRRELSGLSPRVRGNRGPCGEGAERSGSIPACAGEPHSNATGHRGRRVYPRVCGGTAVGVLPGFPSDGLSPRVRGNR